jgi:hypothetical protein
MGVGSGGKIIFHRISTGFPQGELTIVNALG